MVGGILGPHQVGPLLDEILATCLAGEPVDTPVGTYCPGLSVLHCSQVALFPLSPRTADAMLPVSARLYNAAHLAVTNRSARCPHFIVLIICENHVAFLISLEFNPPSCSEQKGLNWPPL